MGTTSSSASKGAATIPPWQRCRTPKGRAFVLFQRWLRDDIGGFAGLTFELSGRQRQDARPGLVKMYRVPPARAWWPAVGAQLERGVRQQRALLEDRPVFACRQFCYPLRATARAVAVFRVCGGCQGLCMALCALQRGPQACVGGCDSLPALTSAAWTDVFIDSSERCRACR